jgi:hypothetical protein
MNVERLHSLLREVADDLRESETRPRLDNLAAALSQQVQ